MGCWEELLFYVLHSMCRSSGFIWIYLIRVIIRLELFKSINLKTIFAYKGGIVDFVLAHRLPWEE